MKPILLGEAPARSGDGRPFTGRAGERLLHLLDLQSYDQLVECFDLRNLFDAPFEKSKKKGDSFPISLARIKGLEFIQNLSQDDSDTVVVAGRRVWSALYLYSSTPWFHHENVDGRVFWLIPHPSGLSTYWNDERRRSDAALFLRTLLTLQGVDLESMRATKPLKLSDAL